MNKPNLLYLAPVAPRPTGGGLAIRAYHNLWALASAYSVYLLIIKIGLRNSPLDPCLFELCHRIVRLSINPLKDFRITSRLLLAKIWARFHFPPPSPPFEWKSISPRRMKSAARAYAGINFEVIHVFRLYMVPYAHLFLNKTFSGIYQLDLDEVESLTRRNLSELYRSNGNKVMARQIAHESKLYEDMERNSLSHFDRVFVSSDLDKVRISDQYNCRQVEVLPNVVPTPKIPPHKRPVRPFTFLLLGSFGYYPNIEGLTFFCNQVLPRIRKDSQIEFVIKVVGGGIPRRLAVRLLRIKEVELIGPVQNVAPYYLESQAALVPIRAGGGTRIKVLEAFAYQVPVVSTSKGIEGLAVSHGKHVLLGDTAASFALQCGRVMVDAELRKTLSENAFSLGYKSHSLKILKEVLYNTKT